MTGWVEMRVAAGVMLALYAGVAAVLSARELRFLAGVERAQRRLFATQDVLVQLAIVGVLLPCTVATHRSKALFVVIFSAFTLLWASALWAVLARSMYTYRLMLGARAERKEFEELLRQGSGAAGSLPANAPGGTPVNSASSGNEAEQPTGGLAVRPPEDRDA